MAKKNEIAEVKKNGMIAAPEFIKQADLAGVADLGQYVIPPRLKVIQGSSKAPFSEMFNPGDAVMVPQMMLVASIEKNEHGRPGQLGGVFHVVPLFFYAEWCLWNPIELKGSKPAIVSRTTDPNSQMVIRSRDPKLRQEPIVGEYDGKGNQLCQRHVEHLNYICVIVDQDHDLHGMPFVLSFSRGDHRSGSNLAALIKLRKAPIYGCRMQARVAFRPDGKGDWYGLDVFNPEDGQAWVTDEIAFQAFKEMHEDFKQAHSAGMIQADYTDDTDDRTINVDKTEF
jgi:hypothetical protein